MPTFSSAESAGSFSGTRQLLACSFVWLALQSHVVLNAKQGEPVERRIDFRDGSTLKITIPSKDLIWKNIAKDGKVTERKVPVSKIKKISLVKVPSTARVARIRNLLSQLSSEDYHKRLEAQILLTQDGKEFEPIIEQFEPDDEETKWRITKVKERLKKESGPGTTASTFDVIELSGEPMPLDGELDLTGLQVTYGESKIDVTRDLVASISDQALQVDFALSSSSGGGKRQQEYPDANGTMPRDMVFVDFEKLPGGKDNSANLDVSKAFVAHGVMFETSISDSYVGTQMYTFGRDGVYSIATVEPTYQGVITISFCVPGNELFAAGTKYVGFNVSHVNPEGTWFEAYDAQGHLITKFTTDESGMDYLGFRSEVPIAKVVVRPNPEIDEDYAIDDLFFEKPVALLESGNPNYFSVVTRKGERLQAESVAVEGDKVVLQQLSFGVEQVTVPSGDIWVMIPSRKKEKKFSVDSMNNHCYSLLADGSIVLSDLARMKRVKFGQQALDPKSLVAFWGIDQQVAAPPTYKIMDGAGAVFAKGKYFDLADVKLGDQWLESPSIADLAKKEANEEGEDVGVDLTSSKYVNSKCVYLRSPTEVNEKLGVIYTYDGERYFMGDGFYAVNVSPAGITLSKGEKSQALNWDEIRSLRFADQKK